MDEKPTAREVIAAWLSEEIDAELGEQEADELLAELAAKGFTVTHPSS